MQATHFDFFSPGLCVFRPARPCVSSRPPRLTLLPRVWGCPS